MVYSVRFNIFGDESLEESYTNWRELKKLNLPQEVNLEEVISFGLSIPEDWQYQFYVAVYDDESPSWSGEPELVETIGLEDFLIANVIGGLPTTPKMLEAALNLANDDTFKRCLKALGWQGGTIHQVLRVLNYSRILVESHDNALATGDWEGFKSKIDQLKLAFKA